MNRYVQWMNDWAYKRDGFIRRWRAQRMEELIERVGLRSGQRVIDLGGTEFMWRLVDVDVHVTLVNTPGSGTEVSDPDRFEVVLGDACALDEFGDRSFDLAFSNSVIEHVGGAVREEAFAREVRRVARSYWVQTPSDHFPLEAHTGVPFYWHLPERARARLLRRWRARSPDWAWAVETTTVLSLDRMRALFPDAEVFVERKLGFEKSYALYRRED